MPTIANDKEHRKYMNTLRIEAAEEALGIRSETDWTTVGDNLIDLLTDLRHWAEHYDIDYDRTDQQAEKYYQSEREG